MGGSRGQYGRNGHFVLPGGLECWEVVTGACGPVSIGVANLDGRTNWPPQAPATYGARSDVMRSDVRRASDLEKPNEIIKLLEAEAIYPPRPTLARSDVFKPDLSRL